MPAYPDLLQVMTIPSKLAIHSTIFIASIEIIPFKRVIQNRQQLLLGGNLDISYTVWILTNKMQGEMDFINSVCPCAGLSMLNRQREGNVSFLSAFCKLLSNHLQFRLYFFFKSLSLFQSGRGADAAQNEWMLKSAEYVLSVVKPKVSVERKQFHTEI